MRTEAEIVVIEQLCIDQQEEIVQKDERIRKLLELIAIQSAATREEIRLGAGKGKTECQTQL